MTRTTRTLAVDRDDPDPEKIDEAARVLRAGGLVAFATETVYGLGAVAIDAEAVARIFEAKGRPPTNPLIVHADGTAMARECVADWPECAEALARAFWPGPLTLVLPRAAKIPDVVTAGLDTVGVRVPGPPVARQLIERTRHPVAAPSANRSSGLSPTLARHVLRDLDGRIDLVLDSGQTTVGLESTVVDLTTRHPRILRPGAITAGHLEHLLGSVRIHEEPGTEPPRPASPGQMAVHYAPRTRAFRAEPPGRLEGFDWPDRTVLLVVGDHELPEPPSFVRTYRLETPEEAARDLYVVLHDCDAEGVDLIVVVPPPDRPEWHAVRDRLMRATRPME